MTTYDQHPDITLHFHTRDGLEFKYKAIRGYRSEKHLDNPVHAANVTLMGDRLEAQENRVIADAPILNIIRDNDLCTTTLRDANGQEWPDVTGRISVVDVAEFETDGTPQKRIELGIEGIGKALTDYQIFWHPHLAGRNNLGGVGWMARTNGAIPGGRPHEVLHQLYRTFINDGYVLRFADSRKLSEVFELQFNSSKDALSKTALNAMGGEGTLWDNMSRYADKPWHELFVDYRYEGGADNKIGLYFRPTPWHLEAWDRMERDAGGWGYTYEWQERIGDGEDLDRNENRVYNFFWVPAKAMYSGFDQLSLAFDQSGGRLPIYVEDSIRRYGLRRLEMATEYIEYLTKQDAKQGIRSAVDMQRSGSPYSKLWHSQLAKTLFLCQNYGYEEFVEGTISLRGRIGSDPQYGLRMGAALSKNRDSKNNWSRFYTTGIVQRWEFPGPWVTTALVGRGHDPYHYSKWWYDSVEALKLDNEFSHQFQRVKQQLPGPIA